MKNRINYTLIALTTLCAICALWINWPAAVLTAAAVSLYFVRPKIMGWL